MLNSLKQIILNAGKMIRNAQDIHSHEKTSFRDIVTQWDMRVQEYIKNELTKLAHDADFLGEEGEQSAVKHDKCFIVDPIDGTCNFRYGIRKSACSIAYVEHGVIEFGLVYDPYLDELFYAEHGKGSYCNGNAIHALSGTMENGITIFGTNPYHSNTIDDTFALAKACYSKTMDLRRFGAASLDICYVASGRAILFFEGNLCPWDFAAGKLIAEEQGLLLRNWDNKELDIFKNQGIVCANKLACEQWFDIKTKI